MALLYTARLGQIGRALVPHAEEQKITKYKNLTFRVKPDEEKVSRTKKLAVYNE